VPRHLAVLLAAVALAALANIGLSAAQSGADFEMSITNNYPDNLEFRVSATSDTEITDVSLRYSIIGRGTTALGKPEELLAGTSVSVSIEVETNSQSSYIPVGSEFVYFWELTLSDGSTATSEEETFFFLPPDQDWQIASNDIVAVYYHGDRERTANLYLDAATETYEVIGRQILNTTLTQLPVRVIMFSNEAEMNVARPGVSESFDAAVTVCGTKVTNDIVLVIPVICGGSDPTNTLRHEFTHILTEAAGESALGKLPAWLNEGTAVLGQTEPGDGYVRPFEIAAQIDRLIPFNLAGTVSNDPQLVNLYYGQAYAMVDYLITQYGDESFAELFATIKRGNRFDTALEEVYGFDLDGFETEFRQFYGLDGATEPTAVPTPAPRQDTARPTAPPTEAPQATSVVMDTDDGFGTAFIFVIAGAVLFALLAVFLYLISMMIASGREGGGEA
jgi:Peptidase MA superfamily